MLEAMPAAVNLETPAPTKESEQEITRVVYCLKMLLAPT